MIKKSGFGLFIGLLALGATATPALARRSTGSYTSYVCASTYDACIASFNPYSVCPVYCNQACGVTCNGQGSASPSWTALGCGLANGQWCWTCTSTCS